MQTDPSPGAVPSLTQCFYMGKKRQLGSEDQLVQHDGIKASLYDDPECNSIKAAIPRVAVTIHGSLFQIGNPALELLEWPQNSGSVGVTCGSCFSLQ
ncbi:hypothetical protein VNO77_08208 [Canavalia gladiata]|uniref:Uncharacterized protein n=1 Tax=Canavalia gladiata TaxID=3824 RepID=A0AAN9M929_CANGL